MNPANPNPNPTPNPNPNPNPITANAEDNFWALAYASSYESYASYAPYASYESYASYASYASYESYESYASYASYESLFLSHSSRRGERLDSRLRVARPIDHERARHQPRPARSPGWG